MQKGGAGDGVGAEPRRWAQQLEGTSCMKEEGMGTELGDRDLGADLLAEKGHFVALEGQWGTDRQTD